MFRSFYLRLDTLPITYNRLVKDIISRNRNVTFGKYGMENFFQIKLQIYYFCFRVPGVIPRGYPLRQSSKS